MWQHQLTADVSATVKHHDNLMVIDWLAQQELYYIETIYVEIYTRCQYFM